MTTAVLKIPAPARLLTTNAERSLHWSRRAEVVKLWRQASSVLARHEKMPRFERAEVGFAIHQARGKLADAGAHHPVTKAVLDGLVDAGVLASDDPNHVVSVLEYSPERAGADAVIVRLRGELL